MRNHTQADISFTWDVYETTQQGSGTVPAGGEVRFNTTTVAGPNTVRLFVDGHEVDVKASQPNRCNDNPPPPPTEDTPPCARDGRLDCSSLEVTATCDAHAAVFTILNTGEPGNGDMVAATEWRLFVDGVLQRTGTVQLAGGATLQVRWDGAGSARLEADQQVGHPGNSHPNASITCQTAPPPTNTPTFTPVPTNTPIPTNTPTATVTLTPTLDYPAYDPLDACWVQHWNETGSTEWRIENPNPVPLSGTENYKVLYNWTVYDAFDGQGSVLQSAQGWDSPNPNPVNTVYAQSLRLEWYIDRDGQRSDILGTVIVNANAEDRCQVDVTSTPTFTPTATATDQATNTPTFTPTNTATDQATNTPTSTATATDQATNTPTNTATATVTDQATNTPTNTATATATDQATNTPTSTATATATDQATNTPTSTATATATDQATNTPTNTPTATPTSTPTNTPTATLTNTPTNTPTPDTGCDFNVAAGDVVGLKAAINGANNDGVASVICLEGGEYALSEPLPSLTSAMTIEGNGSTVKRNASAPGFRVMTVANADVTLNNFSITGGQTTNDGGGLYSFNATLTLSNITISGNGASNGGGLYLDTSTTTISGGAVSGNSATAEGGGIFARGGTASVDGITIQQNTAPSGGGLYNSASIISLFNSTMHENSADFGGGVYNDGDLNVQDTDLNMNQSVQFGGAMTTENANMQVNESCIRNNSSTSGSGIYNASISDTTEINAIRNWWGAPDGPTVETSSGSTGSGDSIAGPVAYEPFYIEPLPICGGSENPPLSSSG